MNRAILDNCPKLLREFLFYLETIRGRSPKTVDAYYIDLHTFFCFMKIQKKLCSPDTPFFEIDISDISLDFIRSVTLADVYEYLNYTMSERDNNAKTRARKVSSLRSFYKYLTTKANVLSENPIQELEVPSLKKSLPKYLTLEQSLELLSHIDSSAPKRDYCMVTLFLNCGIRLSELVGLNLSSIRLDSKTMVVLGKGNKERMLYLNSACVNALEEYLQERSGVPVKDPKALFLSSRGTRITARRVQQIIQRSLDQAGLSGQGFSTHKLRHTAATLLYQQGGVDIRVLQQMLGHVNLGTTEIYTHTSNQQLQEAAERSPLKNVKQKPSPSSKPSKEQDK